MATPTGPIIAPPGQYTHCVDRKDYRDVPGLFDEGIPTMIEFILCEYLLGGKLVCLAGGADRCAIGVVASVEQVGAGKSGFDAIDNDFSFNVVLAPYTPRDFHVYGPPAPGHNVVEPHQVRDDVAAHSPQGFLLLDAPSPTSLPAPVDQSGAPGPPLGSAQPQGTATWPNDGYGVLWKLEGGDVVDAHQIEGNNLHKLYDTPAGDDWPALPTGGDYVALPVIHCECEGSRICFVCQAMKPFLEAMQGKIPGTDFSPSAACHAVAKWLPWPLNKLVKAVCSFVEDIVAIPIALALAPAAAAAFATAWETAQAFDDLFVTGPVAKQIHVGDVVIVSGRWAWDGGHSGHTELHPVKTIQKLQTPPFVIPPEVRPPAPEYDPRKPLTPAVADDIIEAHDRWCHLVGEAPPPPDPRHPDGLTPPQLGALTPGQLAVHGEQQKPENTWELHPLIDGCAPAHDPDPIR
jgi:hypothetical protein